MKAIRVRNFGDPEVMQIETLEDPKPGHGQVLIEIKAIGVNPVESYMRSGAYARKPELPYTPGSDGAGIVRETGPGINTFKPGDRVYTSGSITGTYAELSVCPEAHVHRLPDHSTFQEGAALGIPYATAYRALFQKANAKAGETILIHGGSGGVGLAAIQLARNQGLRIIATGSTETGRSLMECHGADLTLDHSDASHFERIIQETEGKGVNLVLEMLANVNLANDLKVLANQGRIVVIGSRGNVEIDPRQLMMRETSLMGMVLFNVSEEDLKCIHAGLAAGLKNESLKPVIGKEFSLKEAPKAHKTIMEAGAYGKIVLIP